MKFHPPWQDRVALLIVLVVGIGLVGFSGYMALRGATSRIGSWRQSFGITGALLAAAVYFNWYAYQRTIRIHDLGIEWKDWTETVSYRWDEIQGLGFKKYTKVTKAGLVLKSTMALKFLPFFSPALYAGLKDRCGRLPAEVEKALGVRS
ncbi:MAG TPA: hypothetical protein VE981_07875 [Planctomycetota bacterium]|nr:hypothetical protein [Planctomycetota bacterium]